METIRGHLFDHWTRRHSWGKGCFLVVMWAQRRFKHYDELPRKFRLMVHQFSDSSLIRTLISSMHLFPLHRLRKWMFWIHHGRSLASMTGHSRWSILCSYWIEPHQLPTQRRWTGTWRYPLSSRALALLIVKYRWDGFDIYVWCVHIIILHSWIL